MSSWIATLILRDMVSPETWSSLIWLDFLAVNFRHLPLSVSLALGLQVDIAIPSIYIGVLYRLGHHFSPSLEFFRVLWASGT